MSAYNEQYRQYYEGLKSKAISQGMRGNRVYEYSPIYGGYSSMNNRVPTKNHLSDWINIFISQLVITIILSLTILYMKYSSDSRAIDAFRAFKDGVSGNISYSEIYENVKDIDIKNIIDKANSSIQWIKEKVDENPLNY